MRQAAASALLAVMVAIAALVALPHMFGATRRTASPVHATAHRARHRTVQAVRPSSVPRHHATTHRQHVELEGLAEVIARTRLVVAAADKADPGSALLGCVRDSTTPDVLPGVSRPWVCYSTTGMVEVGRTQKGEVIARVLATVAVTLPPGASLHTPGAT